MCPHSGGAAGKGVQPNAERSAANEREVLREYVVAVYITRLTRRKLVPVKGVRCQGISILNLNASSNILLTVCIEFLNKCCQCLIDSNAKRQQRLLV